MMIKHEMGVLARAVSGDIGDKGPLGLIKLVQSELECVNSKNLNYLYTV